MDDKQISYIALFVITSVLVAALLLVWELLRAQMRFKAICDNSGNMVVIGRAIVDKSKKIIDFEIVGCNEIYASHQHKTLAEVIGLRIVRDFYKGVEPEWFHVVQEVVSSHASRHLEFEYAPLGTRYSGSVFCLSAVGKRCCFIMDEISEEYNRARELQQARELMDSVLDLSGIGLWRWNLRTDTITILKSSFKLFVPNDVNVFSRNDFVNRLHPSDRHLFDNIAEIGVRKNESENPVIVRLRDPAGGWFWLQAVSVKAECDAEGKTESIYGVFWDVDSLKRSQYKVEKVSQELERKQRQLLHTMQQCRTGCCSWNVQSDRVYFEENFWESVGGVKPDLDFSVPDTMEHLQQQVIPDNPDGVAEWISQIRDGNPAINEFYFRCQIVFLADEWLEVRNSVAERDSEGRPLVISAVVINVSSLKKHELALESAMFLADKANKAKSHFLAVISHEIRTPLNAIIGFSGMIKKADVAGKIQSYANFIKTSGEMLMSLINDLLDIVKIESSKMDLYLAPLCLSDLLYELRGMFEIKLNAKGLYLNIDCPDDQRLLNLDVKRLRQVLINLIGNALKFTHTGGVTVEVQIEPLQRAPSSAAGAEFCRVMIAVKDTGEGIREQDFASIFEPFEQACNPNHKYVDGSGLGLPISRNLVELMGGRITFESRIGAGSSFYVTLESVGMVPRGTEGDQRAGSCAAHGDHPEMPAVPLVKGMSRELLDEVAAQFGSRLKEMESGLHVQAAYLLIEDLQQWMEGRETSQLQVLVERLAKAVEDFDVTEVRRICALLLKQGEGQ